MVCQSRNNLLSQVSSDNFFSYKHLNLSNKLSEIDLKHLEILLKNFCKCEDNDNFCNNCKNFMILFEFKRAEYYKCLVNKLILNYIFEIK